MIRARTAGAAALLLLPVALLVGSCLGQPRIAFVVQDDRAPWIMAPLKPTGLLGLADRDDLPVTRFRRRFPSPDAGGPGTRLEVRALRNFRLLLNDEPLGVDSEPGRHWRAFRRVDLAGRLRPGDNELRVEVTNATGPALLSVRVSGLADPVATDRSWQVSQAGGPWQAAIRVHADHVNPSSYAMPSPAEAFAGRSGALLALAALSALAFGLSRTGAGRRWMPAALLLGVGGVWAALLARALEIPLDAGFDAHHHLKYVDHLREQRSLPLATDGWMMFHPPVYYALTALLVEIHAGPLSWRLLGWLAGLATALACGALARRCLDGRREAALALGFAALLPMNLYISSYVTNESLHTALACAVVAWTARLLRCEHPTSRDLLVWAGLVSLAVLTKYTAWIVAGLAGLFLLARWLRVERAGGDAVARRVALAAGTVLVLAGWLYARNLLHFGNPFPLNVDLPGETKQWWAQPGYYTPAFFLRFGDVLHHPFLAGFHSAWDSFYATLWGDGQLGGQVIARFRHPHWDWELMAAGYWLALPATVLLLAGALRSLSRALRANDPGVRAVHAFLLTLGWALLLSVLYMTLRQQDYGQAKAFYGMAGIAPLSVFFALGAGGADRWLEARGATWARGLLYAWLGTFAGTVALSFAG